MPEFHPSEIPQKPGVYIFRDRFGQVIYVGKASNLRRRMSSYFQASRVARADAKLRSLINSITEFSFQAVRTADEALILESRLIKEFAPRYNILMRDDKRYPMLKIDLKERFPTIKLARVKKDDGAKYFGPFPQGAALKETLEFLLAHFGLRACRDSSPNEETRKRCLKRIVKDCSAPCTGAISEEDYRKLISDVIAVFEGKIAPICAIVQEKMQQAAVKQNFEKAAKLRDIINNLESVFGARNRAFENPNLPNQITGKQAAKELEEKLGLPAYPETIICFDNSNLLGTYAVSSMVFFRDGKPERSSYKRFRVKTVIGADDFATMHEILTRHFSRLLNEKRQLPHLVVVDGGKGQLSSAVDALIAVGCPPIPVIGIAKANEEIFLPAKSEPIILSRDSMALKLIQHLRDEAHRFAISYHRKLRLKAIEQSMLDDIPGIGDIRKKQLLKAFGSIRAIKKATSAEIARKVPGLGEILAEQIIRHFN